MFSYKLVVLILLLYFFLVCVSSASLWFFFFPNEWFATWMFMDYRITFIRLDINVNTHKPPTKRNKWFQQKCSRENECHDSYSISRPYKSHKQIAECVSTMRVWSFLLLNFCTNHLKERIVDQLWVHINTSNTYYIKWDFFNYFFQTFFFVKNFFSHKMFLFSHTNLKIFNKFFSSIYTIHFHQFNLIGTSYVSTYQITPIEPKKIYYYSVWSKKNFILPFRNHKSSHFLKISNYLFL